MNKSSAILIILIIVIVTLPIFFITIPILFIMYNGIVKSKNRVEMSYSSIDVFLKKRHDLIPNLVSSVKEIMQQEREVFEKITRLRSRIPETTNKEKRFELENDLSQALGSINVAVENYPDLKSTENMLQFQRSLNEIEEQLSAVRRAYNQNVLVFNDKVVSVPSNVMAGLLEYDKEPYFEIPEVEKANPNVGSLFR
ncbi:MAG: LemA family protein [Nonlabens sp.]